jgi:hypothetical protein
MKTLLAAVLVLILFSCKKSSDQETVCVDGTLRYSSPAVDGAGWYLQVNDTSSITYMILESTIPAADRIADRQVSACLQETSQRYTAAMAPSPSDLYYFRVVTIRPR